MANFDMNIKMDDVVWTMAVQGFGVGWLWVPMSMVIFSNLDPRPSAVGAAMFHFVRSVASSYFISASLVAVFHTQNMNYADLVQWINPFRVRTSTGGIGAGNLDADTARGLAGIAGEVSRQAANIGYINAFHLFMWTTLIVYPLIALIVWPPKHIAAGERR